jgi:stage III sporulation protein AE
MSTRIKFIILLLILVAISLSFHTTTFADEQEELSENLSTILNSLDLTQLQQYLDENSNSFINNYGQTASEIIEYLYKGNLNVNYSSYINEILSLIFKDLISIIPTFAQIIAISILCAIVTSAEGNIIGKTTAKVVRLTCYAMIILITASMLVGILSVINSCITNIKKQIEIIMPILITLTLLTGGANSGAIYQPSAAFLSSGAVELVSGFVFPVTIGIIVLDLLSKLNNQISFSGVTKFIKSILKWVLGIIVAVFSIFITVQSSSSSLFDGIFFKTTKYLVGSSVPIVGNFLSSGVDMVVCAGTVIKSSVGVLGIVLLISEIIQPIILIAGFSLMLKFAGAIVQPLGENDLYSLFSDLASDVEYIFAGLMTIAFMYLLVVMLIINSANSII